MVTSRRFQAALGCAGALMLASASREAKYNPQHIVLGKNGKLLDVDPSLYFHDRSKKWSSASRAGAPPLLLKTEHHHHYHHEKAESQLNSVVSARVSKLSISIMGEAEAKRLISEKALNAVVLGQGVDAVVVVSAIQNAYDQAQPIEHLVDFGVQLEHEQEPNEHDSRVQECDYDEFSNGLSSSSAPETELRQAVDVPEVSMVDHSDIFDSALPIVPGSILFAEMSCLFVGFIGYLVHSIPLWSRFSRGQRWCLVVAFTAALLYQLAAISWYFDLVSPEVMIGLSSLITRMISLGMVPITTTSFVGRAREACSEQQQLNQQNSQQMAVNASYHGGRGSRHNNHHHPRARAS